MSSENRVKIVDAKSHPCSSGSPPTHPLRRRRSYSGAWRLWIATSRRKRYPRNLRGAIIHEGTSEIHPLTQAATRWATARMANCVQSLSAVCHHKDPLLYPLRTMQIAKTIPPLSCSLCLRQPGQPLPSQIYPLCPYRALAHKPMISGTQVTRRGICAASLQSLALRLRSGQASNLQSPVSSLRSSPLTLLSTTALAASALSPIATVARITNCSNSASNHSSTCNIAARSTPTASPATARGF